MEGLRARRRLVFSPATPPARSLDEDDKQRRYIYVKRNYVALLLALLALQFIVITYVTVKNRFFAAARAQSETTQRETLRNKDLDVIVTVYTYDRPRQLHALLLDIAREADASGLRVHVNIIDDASLLCSNPHPPTAINHFDTPTANITTLLHEVTETSSTTCLSRNRYAKITSLAQSRNWRVYSSYVRHGRRRYWHLIRAAHQLLRDTNSQYYIFLPDDDRLCHNFFTLAIESWERLRDARKTTLMFHIESTREHVPVWTDIRPRRVGDGMWRIGWVESGNFIATSKLLELFNYSFPRVPPQRWIDNPPISSGVGALFSETIHSHGLRMYRTSESLVAHVGVSTSKMNAQFRQHGTRALETLHFADGDAEYERHVEQAQAVHGSMASIWTRESSMLFAVDSLASQVDYLHVYLNGYDHIPATLAALPWVTIVQGAEDIGDIGKFYFHQQLDATWHATVDDDIVYPPDYIERLLEFHRSFHSPVIVGVHGIRIIEGKLRNHGYYASRRVFMGVEHMPRQKVVHILGTGTVLYRVSDLGKFALRDVFKTPNMADIWLGGLAQQRKIPMLVMPHNASWLREVDGTFDDSIYVRSTKSRAADQAQTTAALSFAPWQLHYP